MLYRGCPYKVKLHCHGPVGTTELVLYRRLNVLCPLSGSTVLTVTIQGSLNSVYTHSMYNIPYLCVSVTVIV